MTKQQINKAIKVIEDRFANMTREEASSLASGDGFYSILEKAIDSSFSSPEEAANWWINTDPIKDNSYNKIHDAYIMAHSEAMMRLYPERYTTKKVRHCTKVSLLRAVKYHFKQYPSGSVEIHYTKPIPASGEIGTFCYDYKTFKFELGYALSQNAEIAQILFKY